jgi:hypothetical protein
MTWSEPKRLYIFKAITLGFGACPFQHKLTPEEREPGQFPANPQMNHELLSQHVIALSFSLSRKTGEAYPQVCSGGFGLKL